MDNKDSYNLLRFLQDRVSMKTYQADGKVEFTLQFITLDGKIHQVCNSHVKVYNETNTN